MAHLSLSFLGSFTAKQDEQPISGFESDKVRALLAYLVVEAGRPHRRSRLVGLLWPEYPESKARASLRNALANLRRVIQDANAAPSFLLIDSEAIQFNPESDHWLDVCEFEQLLLTSDRSSSLQDKDLISKRTSAVSLYQGRFLQGFSLKDSTEFDEWVLVKQEYLQRKAMSALVDLANYYEAQGNYLQACEYAQRQVVLEPWHEEAYRQLMRLLALSGNRSTALAQFESCRRSLEEELGVQPDQDTLRLYEQIRDGELRGAAEVKIPLHNLPAMLTPLVGRERELVSLLHRLTDPACRLLSVVGPGGCGKTRLALEASLRIIHRYAHGVFFVSLAGIHEPEAIPQALAQAIGLSFESQREPWQQLLDYLNQKEMLLILDNFEHLLEEGQRVVKLLQTAPDLKILVTSRARLNMSQEELFPLSGMDYPPLVPPAKMAVMDQVSYDQYSAVQLFLEGARRVLPGYAPTADEYISIGEACRLVQGMPLAVLLAASWMTLLNPAEIASQIQHSSLDFLKMEWQDLPARHRSIRAVFEHSWNLLCKPERDILASLSVFQGSFSLQAAQEVAGCVLDDLLILVNRTLLQRTSTGRFELHFLLRQFVSEKLAQQPEQQEFAFDRHCVYYIRLLESWADKLKGAEQNQAIREMPLESFNARAAWEWAFERRQLSRLVLATDGIAGMYERQCLFREGEALFQGVIEQLSPVIQRDIVLQTELLTFTKGGEAEKTGETGLRLYVRALGWHGFFSRLLGKHQAARETLNRGLDTVQNSGLHGLDVRSEQAFLLHQAGILEFGQDRNRSRQDLQQAIELYQQTGNDWRRAQALISLSQTASALGNYEHARSLLDQSLKLGELLGDQIGIASTLQEMSSLEVAEFGNLDRASTLLQERMKILHDLDNPVDIAENLFSSFVCETYRGQFEEAVKLGEQALAIYKNLGMRSKAVILSSLMSWADINFGRYGIGLENSMMCLATLREQDNLSLTAMCLLGVGNVRVVQREYAQAKEVLEEAIALYHQARQEDELSLTLGFLSYAEFYSGQHDQALSHFQKAGQIVMKTRSWQAAVSYLGIGALLLAEWGKIERGIEIYTLATRYPYLGNSRYWHDIAGNRIASLSAGLPESVVLAAQERGKVRELYATVEELEGEFARQDWGTPRL